MKHPLWIVGAVAAPALLSSVQPADDVVFAPSEGTSVTRVVAMEMTTTIDDVEAIVNGEAQPNPGVELEIVLESTYRITDTFDGVGSGRPTTLTRTFDELESDQSMELDHPMAGEQSMEMSSSSELEGHSIVFSWNAETEEYDVAFAEDDDGGDDELLEELVEDMDLRSFLPQGGVSEGDSWEVPPSATKFLLAPGGNLHLVAEDTDDPLGLGDAGMSDFSQLLDDVDGTITATYDGRREADGRSIGVISLVVEVSSSADVTEMTAEASTEQFEAMGIEREVESADISFEFELTGTLTWDLAGGHLHSLEMSGDTNTVTDTVATMVAMGSEFETEESVYTIGEMTLTIEIER